MRLNSISYPLMRIVYGLILIFFCTSVSYAAQRTFQIVGVKDKEYENVQNRLTDFFHQIDRHHVEPEFIQKQVRSALRPYGYFNPTIHITMPSGKKSGLIQIHPGPKLVIRSLTVSVIGMGRDNHEIRQAQNTLPIQVGDGFNSILYQEAKNKLTNAAENQGYLNAQFEVAQVMVYQDENAADITLRMNTQTRSYFGRIQFGTGFAKPTPQVKNGLPLPKFSTLVDILNPDGSTHSLFSRHRIVLSNRLLFKYVPFQFGSPYSNDDISELTSNLKSSGYFKAVDVTPKNQYSYAHYVPLNVYLEPVERLRYSISGGYGTDTGARGRIGIHMVPVNSYGHKIDVIGQGSSNQNAAQLKYSIPGRDPIRDQYNINGGFNNLNYVSGNSQAGRMSILYEHITPKYQRILSVNGLHEAFRYSKKAPDERTLLYPKATVAWREVSNPLFSPSGYNVTVTGYAASRRAISSISMAVLDVDAKAALTVDAIRTRFYAHVEGGINQVNDVYTLPLSLALLLGGPEDMKGFSYNSIGPGKRLAYGGLEFQKETIESWYVIGFVDKGTVFDPDDRLVQYDMGIGLLWRSPVGPIKMAIAQPTDSRFSPLKDTGFRFVANMGPDI